MDVGHLILCASDGWPDITDAQVYREEIQLARLADDLGYDMVWAASHFDGYSMVPDNMQVLAHLAGMVNRITLGTAAIILPWHDPLRVVESICVLDNLTDGRLRIGFGRGAARMEFNGFREGSMDESRERFDEAVDIIMPRPGDRGDRGRRPVLQAAVDQNTAATGAVLPGPDLFGRLE